MGRELKRVSMDFEWPLNKVWQGFINPNWQRSHKCHDCKNGYGERAQYLEDLWYGHVSFYPDKPFTADNQHVVALAKRNSLHNAAYWIGVQDDNPDPVIAYAACKILGRKTTYAADAAAQIVAMTCKRNVEYLAERMFAEELQRLLKHFNSAWMHHLTQEDVQALMKGSALWDFTHRPRSPEQAEQLKREKEEGGNGYWLKEWNGYTPTADEVNEFSLHDFGFSGKGGVVIAARCEREGVEVYCHICKGEGRVWPDADGKTGAEWKKIYEDWEKSEPPTGEGYQIWETVSEGSPVSPVFATPEELALWMVGKNEAGVPNDMSVTRDTGYEGWLKFINGPGWACSAVGIGGEMVSGVKAVSDMVEEE